MGSDQVINKHITASCSVQASSMSMKPVGKLHDLFSMPSLSQTVNSEYHETPVMNHNTPAKRISPKCRSHRDRKPLKPGKTTDQTERESSLHSIPAVPSGNHHKPWPSRKVKGVDEVVKYMSTVPSYLQKGDSVQEKALNFGVLDWGRLEKWTYNQKQVADRRGVDSQSSSSSSPSSTFSTFGPTSQSTVSIDSPSAQRKKSPAMDSRRNSSVESHPAKLKVGQNSPKLMGNADRNEKGKINLNREGISGDTFQPPDISSSSCTSNVTNTSACAHNKVRSQDGRSRRSEKFRNCETQSFSHNMASSENLLQDQCSAVEGKWDYLQESVHSTRTSCDSATVNKGRSVNETRNSFSGDFFSSDVRFTNLPAPIPYSCPLPSTSQNGEPSMTSGIEILTEKSSINVDERSKLKSSAPPRRELSPHRLFSAGLSRIRSSSLREPATSTDISHQDAAISQTGARRSVSPHQFLSAGLNWIRNSRLREGSTEIDIRQQAICPDNLKEENVVCNNNRSRQSPLWRFLDPLLKSKNAVTSLRSLNEQCTLSETKTESVSDQVDDAEKYVISTRQALLKLAWKNELPLFVFTLDGNSLAATMGKRSITYKNDLECIYTIFTANELKRKSGIRIGQGNKSKKHDLACNVVGKMRVSCSESTSSDAKNYFFTREFVLFGNEQVPTTSGCVSSLFNSELVAMIIHVQTGRPENCELQRYSTENRHSVGSLRINENNESSNHGGVVAIIPSGVHGSSSKGQPLPLIERWKSGGSCDCGGWDEGCQLTVLVDKTNPDSRGSKFSQDSTEDGTYRIELFTQGALRENKHTFRMTAFKEGVYTVDFGPSITAVQAFAMSIAILHSKKPTTLSALHYSMKAQSFQEHTFTSAVKNTDPTPTSYVPDHPPLSPVGRA